MLREEHELRGELAQIKALEKRVAALELELWNLRLLMQDVLGDLPDGIRSNAAETARQYLSEIGV